MKTYIEERLAEFTKEGKVFNTVIRQCEEINKAKMERKPVNLYAPKSRGASDYLSLMEEVICNG